jgi:hypothetical protein
VHSVIDHAAAEIVEAMQDENRKLYADVMLYHGNRVVAIVQYACGDGVIVRPEIQAHF